MNKKTSLLLMILGMVLFAGGFAACDSDDSDKDPLAVKSVNAEYSAKLNPTWFEFYDIKVTWLDDKGQTHSADITDGWNYGFSVKPEVAPKNYLFSVTATPKTATPELTESQYVLTCEIEGNFFGVRYNGETYRELWSDLHPYNLQNNDVYTFSQSQFKDYLEGGVRNLMNFKKTFDGRY